MKHETTVATVRGVVGVGGEVRVDVGAAVGIGTGSDELGVLYPDLGRDGDRHWYAAYRALPLTAADLPEGIAAGDVHRAVLLLGPPMLHDLSAGQTVRVQRIAAVLALHREHGVLVFEPPALCVLPYVCSSVGSSLSPQGSLPQDLLQQLPVALREHWQTLTASLLASRAPERSAPSSVTPGGVALTGSAAAPGLLTRIDLAWRAAIDAWLAANAERLTSEDSALAVTQTRQCIDQVAIRRGIDFLALLDWLEVLDEAYYRLSGQWSRMANDQAMTTGIVNDVLATVVSELSGREYRDPWQVEDLAPESDSAPKDVAPVATRAPAAHDAPGACA